MSAAIYLAPGMTLVASVAFLTAGTLFVSIVGPAAISFSSLSPSGGKELYNSSSDVWRLSVRASHGGPIGAEVPVVVTYQAGPITIISVGISVQYPDARLVCAVTPTG